MIEKIKMPWSLMRLMRLIMGIFILAQGILTSQISAIVIGIVFTALPIFNLGCGCEGSSCSIDSKQYKNEG